MRNLVYLLAFLMSHVSTFGQHAECSVQAGSGLFSYGGPNSVNETSIDVFNGAYVYSPYGRAGGFSYSLTGQVQGIARANWIYGIQAGYEQLKSRVAITSIAGDIIPFTPATGRAELKNHYLNLNPFIGKRFGTTRFCLDATVGLDVGIGLVSKIRAELVSPSWPWMASGESKRSMPDVDLRPRLNLTGYYRAFGVSIGYSRGLTNYTPNAYATNASTYAQYWRAGIVYRFGKPM